MPSAGDYRAAANRIGEVSITFADAAARRPANPRTTKDDIVHTLDRLEKFAALG